jgi:hypothetical protein
MGSRQAAITIRNWQDLERLIVTLGTLDRIVFVIGERQAVVNSQVTLHAGDVELKPELFRLPPSTWIVKTPPLASVPMANT